MTGCHGCANDASPDSREIRLQERDYELLSELATHKVMSRDQIIALGFFSSVPRANFRLKQLKDSGLIGEYEPNIRLRSGGSIYYAQARAIAVLNQKLDSKLHASCIKHPGSVSPVVLEHTLRITDVRIALLKALGEAGKILTWLPELLCRHEYSICRQSGLWSKQIVKPDAFARVSYHQRAHSFLFEVDLGHVSQRRLTETMRCYERYKRGAYQHAYGDHPFEVVLVTTNRTRVLNLKGALRQFDNLEICCWTDFGDLIQKRLDQQIPEGVTP
ncbi:MAG: replication-relaxation family protein [Fimbriimonadales bacterium]